jgi:antibiotic biosynthesis monooxygenase (ABM) superfamily enzyme
MSDKRTPSIHRRVVLTWIAVYPTITILQSVLGTKVAGYPLPVRTLVLTVFMAPLVTYLMLPAVMKAHSRVTARASRTRNPVARRRISG